MATKFVIILTALMHICSSQTIGSSCWNDLEDFQGICKEYNHCPSAFNKTREEIRKITCSKTPLGVCCESYVDPGRWKKEIRTPQETSRKKCEDYFNPAKTKLSTTEFRFLPLVVGGYKAKLKEFPHMAALGYPSGLWKCGGTLISENVVMTAAHCIFGKEQPHKVRLGDLNLAHEEDGARPEDIEIADFKMHPNYSPTLRYNDIALLKLKRNVTFNDFIQPACLWTDDDIPSPTAVATGWGSTDFGDETSDHLLKVNLTVHNLTTCKEIFARSFFLSMGLVDSMLCVGEISEKKDTCLGDSGGPLVLEKKNEDKFYHVIGVTSFGNKCGAGPGIYTRVSSFIPWIVAETWPQG